MSDRQLVPYDNRTDAELRAEAEQQTRQYLAKLQGTPLVPKELQTPTKAANIHALGIKAFDNLFVATFYAHEAAEGGIKEIYAFRLKDFMSAYQNNGERRTLNNPAVMEIYCILAHRETEKAVVKFEADIAERDAHMQALIASRRERLASPFEERTHKYSEREIQLNLQRHTANELAKRETLKTNHGAYMMRNERKRADIDTEGYRREVLGRPSLAGFFKRHLGLGD